MSGAPCPLPYDKNRDPDPRMQRVDEKVRVIDEIDVTRIGVEPAHRPGIDNLEPKAADLKTRHALDNDRPVDHESVLAAEMGAELFLRDTGAVLCSHRRFTARLFLMLGAFVALLGLLLWGALFLLLLGLLLRGAPFLLRSRLRLFLLRWLGCILCILRNANRSRISEEQEQ